MELHLLLITFLIWFSSWNFIESILKHYKLQNISIMKVSFIGVVVGVYLYHTNKEDNDTNEFIEEYKKDVLKCVDMSEVYKSKIMIGNEVFYGLILCYIVEEDNELSSTPRDYFSYVTFIFKDINRIVKINPVNSGIYLGTLSLNINSTIAAPGVEKN